MTARVRVGPETSGAGDLDSAVFGGGAVWAASDAGGTIARVDPATNAVTVDPATGVVLRTIPLAIPFPVRRAVVETWWLGHGDGGLWASLPNNGGTARVDTASGSVRSVRIPFGDPFGVAVGGGSVWVATDRAVSKLDAATGEPQAASLIPRAGGFGFVSIAYADGAAWLTTYDRGTLIRVTP